MKTLITSLLLISLPFTCFSQKYKFFILPFEMPRREDDYCEKMATYFSNSAFSKSKQSLVRIETQNLDKVIQAKQLY